MLNMTYHQGNINQNSLRYHLMPVSKIITNKNTRDNIYLQGFGEKRTIIYCWWECRLLKTLWKTLLWFPRKVKVELQYYLATLFWVHNHRKWNHHLLKSFALPCSLNSIHNRHHMDPTQEFISEWSKKL
jgi:hypothetical protein